MKKIGKYHNLPIMADTNIDNILKNNEIGCKIEDDGIKLIKRAADGSIEIITTE